MRLLLSIVLVLLIHSCSTSTTQKRAVESSSITQRPDWLTSPMEACQNFELCAVGEGSGHLMAEASARKEIAKIFKTKVKGSTKIYTSAETTGTAEDIRSSEMGEDVYTSIQESTDEVLEGVTIKKLWEDRDEGIVFALGSLHRTKAAQLLRSKMESLDEKMQAQWKDGRRSALNRILKIMAAREAINDRHEFLVGRRVTLPISFAQVMRAKRKKAEEAVRVFVEVSGEKAGGSIYDALVKGLLESDYLITKVRGHAQYAVSAQLKRDKQHMNVDGFEKHKFILKIRSHNSRGEKIGGLAFDTTQTGRSLAQARSKALQKIKVYLAENVGLLNMD